MEPLPPLPSPDRPRSVTLLGATGSVGQSTVALLKERPELYRVEAVTGGRRADLLATTARALRARLAVIADPAGYRPLVEALAGSGIEAAAGPEALIEAAKRPAEWVMSAIVGIAGLPPTLEAVRRGAMVALANKESIVCAGALLLAEAQRSGARILPVDSEHNAIFQVLAGSGRAGVERLVLTASGGPLRSLGLAEMREVTPARALAHPTWSMGAKISIDSATMMNKGLEIIEAHHLFGVPEPSIEVVVHPQSIIHSLVGFADGSCLAQLGVPDMRIPIAHTLGWPGRIATSAPRLDLAAVGRLDFEPAEPERFRALTLARHALRAAGGAPTMLNAANEVAVAAFLEHKIGFLDIARVVETVLEAGGSHPVHGLEDVATCDALARSHARKLVEGGARNGPSGMGPTV
jgi:1-deoxy-D-xylulose-5-phosphate reductoisomerase